MKENPRIITTKKLSLIAAGVAAVMMMSACAANETGTDTGSDGSTGTVALSGSINAGGSSAQTAAQEAWRAGFQDKNPDVTINYDPTGSGTGRQNFTDGGYVIAGTDAAFGTTETSGPFAACAAGSALVEVPAYISAIAVGFNLDGITSLNMDAATIAGIFNGSIAKWNDPAIANLNAGVTLPDLAITPVHRSDKSGTTENFTDYLNKAAPTVWTNKADQTWPTTLQGEAAEKTQGVRQTITSTKGAIGYLDASQAQGMGSVAVLVGSTPVPYSANAAAAAVGASPMETGRSATDLVISVNRTPDGKDMYPVVLVSYLVACQQYSDANVGALVKAYLTYVVSPDGQNAAAKNAGSAPLTSDATLAASVTAAVATIH